MATAILRPSNGLFPTSTSVSAYPAYSKMVGHAPAATAVSTSTVAADGTVTFTALDESAQYVAYANVSGQHRYLDFATLPGADFVDFGVRNSEAFTFSVGQHYAMAAETPLIYSDSYGNLLAGKNLLGDGKAGTMQTQVFDFAFLQRHLRFATHAITLTEIADPSDIAFRRFGPEDGYPFALPDTAEGTSADLTSLATGSLVGKIISIPGSAKYFTSGTAAFVNGSNQVTITGASADWVNAKMTTSAFSTVIASTITDVNTTTGVVTLANNVTAATGTYPYTIGASNLNKGARAVEAATGINFYTAEAPRDLSGLQDFAVGSMIRFTTTRKGRMSMDPVMQLTSENGVQLGLGAVLGGDTGALVQVRGTIGSNERQQLSGTPTAGTLILECPSASLATDGLPIYTPTVPIAFNVTQGALQAALETVYGAGNVQVTGGPLGTAALMIEWINGMANTNIPTRLRKITTGLTGTVTITAIEDGIPNDGTRRLMEIRAGVGVTRTADYLTILNNEATPKNVWRFLPTGAVQMRETTTGTLDVPDPDTGRFGFIDSGGKTAFAVRFPSGATQILATEP